MAPTPGHASLDLQEENITLMNNTTANKDKIFFVFIFVFTIVLYLLKRKSHTYSAK
jgi:hypothetical protein